MLFISLQNSLSKDSMVMSIKLTLLFMDLFKIFKFRFVKEVGKDKLETKSLVIHVEVDPVSQSIHLMSTIHNRHTYTYIIRHITPNTIISNMSLMQ